MNQPLTTAQRLETILVLEGMPAELPLLVDSPDYQHVPEGEDVSEQTEHDRVAQALNLDSATPVDTFIEAQAEHEYRWQDDAKAEA